MKENDKLVVIYGAGKHGKVAADIVEKSGKTVLAFADDRETLVGKSFYGYPVWRGGDYLVETALRETFSVIIAKRNNYSRREIMKKLKAGGIGFGKAIHPAAQLGNNIDIGAGTVIMANSVISPGARIGSHCIVNTGVTIGHDCKIGNFVYFSTGVHLGGSVHVEHFSRIGLGAAIINNIVIAENAVIGAGTVVIRHVAPHTIVAGNPASFLGKNLEK